MSAISPTLNTPLNILNVTLWCTTLHYTVLYDYCTPTCYTTLHKWYNDISFTQWYRIISLTYPYHIQAVSVFHFMFLSYLLANLIVSRSSCCSSSLQQHHFLPLYFIGMQLLLSLFSLQHLVISKLVLISVITVLKIYISVNVISLPFCFVITSPPFNHDAKLKK